MRDGSIDVRDAPIARDVPTRDVMRRDAPATGETCMRDADCTLGLCVLDEAATPVDGARVRLTCGGAGFTAPGSECDENLECENGLCSVAGGCVEPCVNDDDCRGDERCTEVPIATSERTLGFSRACARWQDLPDRVTVTEDDVAARIGGSSDYMLPRSTHTRRSILHLTDATSLGRFIERVQVGGTTVFDFETLGIVIQTNPAVAFFDVAPILLRNNRWPAAVDPRGEVRYRIFEDTSAMHHRIVAEHDTAGGTLDLNVFFVGVARTAANRRVLDQMLEDYGEVLATYGVRVGRVRQRVIPGAMATAFAILDTEDETSELFRFGIGGARPALDVFLISSSPIFLGISGGIPGPLGVHGTGASGVALAFDDLQSLMSAGLIEMDTVIAHEIGHHSGLFHTTEVDGTTIEPIADTPVCGIENDSNGDTVLDAFECEGFDGSNIMFWGPTIPGSTFSAIQRDVVGGNPVLLP